MIRLIKRYGSRKLYDTEESRYVSLEEIGDWVRSGQQIQVKDNLNGDDVTAQTLALVILEEGRRGSTFFTSDLLHQLIQRGESIVNTGVEQIQHGFDRTIEAITPVKRMRDETALLRARLEALEQTLAQFEASAAVPPVSASPDAQPAASTKGDRS